MARVYLKPGDKIEALCTLEIETNTNIQNFKFVEINEAAEGFNFSFYDGDHNYELRYAFDEEGTPNYGRLYYDDAHPLD